MRSKYYDAFTECDDKRNRGEITYFVETILNIICTALEKLYDALKRRSLDWDFYKASIKYLPNANDKTMAELYKQLIIATLFSDTGVSIKGLMEDMNCSKATIMKRIDIIPAELLHTEKVWNEKYYSLNKDECKKYLNMHDQEIG